MTLLAIDAGTTGVTALLVSPAGEVLSTGYAEFPQHFPADGFVEHELGEIWAATLAATRHALTWGDVQISAIGITNQRETICFWDRETLGGARRAIVWQDRRSAGLCIRLREAGHEAFVTEATGLRLDPYFSATKLAWVRENEPAIWQRVLDDDVAIGTVDSYLVARMTRGLEHVTDATNASRTLLYDIRTGEWSPDLCALFEVPIQALPRIVDSYGIVARTDPKAFLGIDAPIAGIAGDQQAALVGQAGFAAGATKCTYGTGSFLLQHTGDQIVRSAHGLLTTVALQHPGGSRDFALEGAIFVTGSAVQWLRDGLGIISDSAQVESLASSASDSGGVVFVPALTGLGAPDWDPQARGLIIGITRGTTSAHIARATLEAIAFEVRDIVTLMESESRTPLSALHVDGGATDDDLLMQIQADALGTIVDRSLHTQTTGLGAAYLAGLGTGAWSSVDELIDSRRSSGRFTPDQATPYDELHARWRDAVERSKNWAQ
jgi:glycerol kinase